MKSRLFYWLSRSKAGLVRTSVQRPQCKGISAKENSLNKVEVIDESNWLLRLGDQISAQSAERVRLAADLARQGFADELIDIVPAYTTLLLCFREPVRQRHTLVRVLQALVDEVMQTQLQSSSGRLIKIPVYYGEEVALDRAEVEQLTDLAFEEVCSLHQSQAYRVYAIGFAPGFAYLGSTPEALHVPRKSTPRLSVPKGSVALADNQTAIYPASSPGGWQIIGRSPVQMIDWHRDSPMLVNAGDKVQFYAISREEFLNLGGVLDAD